MTEKQTTDEAWREVGRQFQALGESLAEAFRTAWKSEETRQHVQDMQDGLKAMIDHLDQAIKEASASSEAQEIREGAEKAAESLRVAWERTWQEARPHLLAALTQINTELQKVIARLREGEPTVETTAEAASDETEGE